MLIALNGISKSYQASHGAPPYQVLKDANLSIDKGEMVAIKGSSGAGKSTLLHIIALQNVATPLLFAKTRKSQMDARAMEQLRNVGMEQMANKRIATLSGGEKQRVAIARAMVNNPEIILADEPTGALDRANTEKIVQLFQQLNEKGKTIIIVTHDDFVAQSCRRIVTIADGVIKST